MPGHRVCVMPEIRLASNVKTDADADTVGSQSPPLSSQRLLERIGGGDEPADIPIADSVTAATASTAATAPVATGAPGGYRTAVYGLFGIAIVAALSLGRPVLMPIMVAMLLSLLLAPAVALLERLRIGRALASLAVIAGSVTVAVVLTTYLAAPAQQWIESGPERLEQLRAKIHVLRAPMDRVKGATDRVAQITTEEPGQPRGVVIEQRWSTVLLENTQSIGINTLVVLVLLYFLLSSGDLFQRKLIRVVPTLSDKIRAIEISRTIQHQIGRYFAAVTAINLGLGIVVGLAMAAAGMPTPALLGAIAALFNFVPYLGSLVTLGIIAVVSVLTFDGIGAMLMPPAIYLACTTIEGQVIQPIVLGRHLSTAPVVIFVWVLLWGWLWGVGGVVIAVPLLVVAKICADHLPSWKPLAELLGRD